MRILKMLEVRPLCVCEITAVLGLAPSTVSNHLSKLKDVGLIIDEKENKWVIHHLNTNTNQTYIKELLSLIMNWISDDPVIRTDREKVMVVDRVKICSTG